MDSNDLKSKWFKPFLIASAIGFIELKRSLLLQDSWSLIYDLKTIINNHFNKI